MSRKLECGYMSMCEMGRGSEEVNSLLDAKGLLISLLKEGRCVYDAYYYDGARRRKLDIECSPSGWYTITEGTWEAEKDEAT